MQIKKFLQLVLLFLLPTASSYGDPITYATCQKHYSNYGANYNYEYPIFIAGDSMYAMPVKRINKEIKARENAVIQDALRDLKNKADNSYSDIGVTYYVYSLNSAFVSIGFDFNVNVRGHASQLWTETSNYDARTGTEISKQIFKHDLSKNKLFTLFNSLLPAACNIRSLDDFNENFIFCIDGKNIDIFFTSNEITDNSCDEPAVTLTPEQYRNLINNNETTRAILNAPAGSFKNKIAQVKTNKCYLYNIPVADSITRGYLINDDKVTILEEKNGWAYILYCAPVSEKIISKWIKGDCIK